MREAIKGLRGGDRTKKVTSVFFLSLPVAVEEQFTDQEGHPGIDMFQVNSMNILHLEMVGVRTSYTSEMPLFQVFRKATTLSEDINEQQKRSAVRSSKKKSG